jgi:mannosyltransferase OCH1-like enzyme
MQGWDQLPEKFHANMRELAEKNPDYQIMRWDEHSLRAECKKLGPAFVQRYDSFKYMMSKVDFGRYVALYNWGGISIDTDMKPIGHIDDTPGLAEYDFIISGAAYPADTLNLVNNAVIIVTPHHPVMRVILGEIVASPYSETDFPVKELYIHNTTGPIFINRIISHHRTKVHILPYKYYEPCLSIDPYCSVDTNTAIMDHQHELSWMDGWVKTLIQIPFILLHYWYLVLLVCVGLYMYSNRASILGLKTRLLNKYNGRRSNN